MPHDERLDERRLERAAVVADLRRDAETKSPIVREVLRGLADRYESGAHRAEAPTTPLAPMVPKARHERLVAVLKAVRDGAADAVALAEAELARVERGL